MSKATLIVSLDFELFWGMQDGMALEQYRDHVLGGRAAVSQMLALFRRHGVHATWATVGFMFAKDDAELKRYYPQADLMPTYANSVLSAYRCLEGGGIQEKDAACHYAPELIREVAKTPGMEIASHTFSHYYCREAGQTVEQFEADLTAAKRIAQDQGYELRSLVLPRNQCEPAYTQCLQKLGFIAYRDEENDWIHEKVKIRPLMRLLRLADVYLPLTGQGGYRPAIEDGVVNLTGSRMYKPFFKPLKAFEPLKLRRIKQQMLHAAKHGLTFHLWWHPHNVGVRTAYHMAQLEEIFAYYEELKQRYGMRSLNMREAAQEILKGT